MHILEFLFLIIMHALGSAVQAQEPPLLVLPKATLEVPVGEGPGHMVAFDADKEGRKGLAVLNMTGNSMSILNIFGVGDIRTAEIGFYSDCKYPREPTNIAAADVTGSGYSDLLVLFSGRECSALVMYRNDGAGNFFWAGEMRELWFPEEVEMYPRQIVTGDLNGNGYSDIVVVHSSRYARGKVSVWLNGQNRFLPAIDISSKWERTGAPPMNSVAGALGPINNHPDACNDLVVGFGEHSVFAVLWNSGCKGGDQWGAFSGVSYSNAGNPIEKIRLADMNKNGFLDVVLLPPNSVLGSYVLNDGNNGFLEAQGGEYFIVENISRDFAIGDFSGNGEWDVVAASLNFGGMMISKNIHTSLQQEITVLGVGHQTASSIVVDEFLPGKGLVVAVADHAQNKVMLMKNFSLH